MFNFQILKSPYHFAYNDLKAECFVKIITLWFLSFFTALQNLNTTLMDWSRFSDNTEIIYTGKNEQTIKNLTIVVATRLSGYSSMASF